MSKEAKARIKINKLLEEAGWRFFDNEGGPANILLENHIKITQQVIDAWGNDYEKIKGGSLDFLLVDSNNKPFCVLEAKKESLHPLVAKEQARKYANTVGAQFIILSNGIVHYLWDLKKGNPKPIYTFPSPGEIGAIINDSFRERGKLSMTGTGGLQRLPTDFVKTELIPLPLTQTQRQIVSQIEREQALVNASKQLIEIFEQKIKDRIAKVWGADKTAPVLYVENDMLTMAAEE